MHTNPIEDKNSKTNMKIQLTVYTICLVTFVSSGVEIPTTNQTSDFFWNGCGKKELTDGKMSSSSEEGDKTGSLVEKTRHAE